MKRSTPMKPGKPLQRRAPLRATAPAKAEVPTARCKAKGCRNRFVKLSMQHRACSPDCAVIVRAQEKAEDARKAAAAERKADQAKRDDLKPLQHWLKKAEAAVNRYVRARDFRFGCVSCDLPANWDGQWHASHLRSVGAASAVRYHLWNIHKSCSACNGPKSGNLGEYLRRLPARMSQDRIDWLYTQNHRADYSREYLERLAQVMNKKARRQEKRNALLDL